MAEMKCQHNLEDRKRLLDQFDDADLSEEVEKLSRTTLVVQTDRALEVIHPGETAFQLVSPYCSTQVRERALAEKSVFGRKVEIPAKKSVSVVRRMLLDRKHTRYEG